MSTAGWIIIVVIFLLNGTLCVSELFRRRNRKKDLEAHRKKMEAEATYRAGLEVLETFTDDDLEDEIERHRLRLT